MTHAILRWGGPTQVWNKGVTTFAAKSLRCKACCHDGNMETSLVRVFGKPIWSRYAGAQLCVLLRFLDMWFLFGKKTRISYTNSGDPRCVSSQDTCRVGRTRKVQHLHILVFGPPLLRLIWPVKHILCCEAHEPFAVRVASGDTCPQDVPITTAPLSECVRSVGRMDELLACVLQQLCVHTSRRSTCRSTTIKQLPKRKSIFTRRQKRCVAMVCDSTATPDK